MLQASGEAVYTSDIGSDAAQLFAAAVESTEPLAHVSAIDPSPALEVRLWTGLSDVMYDATTYMLTWTPTRECLPLLRV